MHQFLRFSFLNATTQWLGGCLICGTASANLFSIFQAFLNQTNLYALSAQTETDVKSETHFTMFGCRVLAAGYRVPGTGTRAPSTGLDLRNSVYGISDRETARAALLRPCSVDAFYLTFVKPPRVLQNCCHTHTVAHCRTGGTQPPATRRIQSVRLKKRKLQ